MPSSAPQLPCTRSSHTRCSCSRSPSSSSSQVPMMLVIGVRISWPSEVSSRSWLRRASASAVSAASRAASAVASPVMSRPVQTNPPLACVFRMTSQVRSSIRTRMSSRDALLHGGGDVAGAAGLALWTKRGQQRLPDTVAQRIAAGCRTAPARSRPHPDRTASPSRTRSGAGLGRVADVKRRNDKQHADSAMPPAERSPIR